MSDLTALQNRQQTLIRKALNGSVWLAPYSATTITTLTSGAGATPTALPTGFVDAGYITKDDGVQFSRDVDTSDTMSWGSFEPTRRDINQDIDTVKWTMQETKRLSLELYYSVDLSAASPTATTGEIAFSKAGSAAPIYRRFVAITQDGVGADAIYMARYHPRLEITAFEDLSWTDGDETQYGVTGTALRDPSLGYSTRLMFGGPGWQTLLVAMGFPALS